MDAIIITVGDEILIGQVVDTNSSWIARKLNLQGIKVQEMLSISDTHEAISESLKYAFDRVDLVLMTGGLGPTKDDITKKTKKYKHSQEEIQENKEFIIYRITKNSFIRNR